MLRMASVVALSSLVFSFSAFSNVAVDPLDMDKFEFPAPGKTELGKELTLWATYYYLPEINESEGGAYPLRDMQGQEIGPRMSLRNWCDTAMEGSVKINQINGEVKTFNYQGVTNDYIVDCTSIYPRHKAIGRTKYREANGVYGDGLDDYILSPYRTFATDVTYITPGTALYVPAARGAKITTPTGRVITHDGYFFAADKGGAIKGTHIDVYIGTSKKAPFFPWIGSKESKTFKAYVVKDQKVIQELLELHTIK